MNTKDILEFYRTACSEGVPKEFMPRFDEHETMVSDIFYGKYFDSFYEKNLGVSDSNGKDIDCKKSSDRKLLWPSICWICREPIFKRNSYIICSGFCKRAYHNKCQNLVKGQFNVALGRIRKKKTSGNDLHEHAVTEKANSCTFSGNGNVWQSHRSDVAIVSENSMNHSEHPSKIVRINYYGSNKDDDLCVRIGSNVEKMCFFCSISYIGCSGCRRFSLLKNMVKCVIEDCTTFYCYPSCVSRTRVIIPDKKVINAHMSIYGNLRHLLDPLGRPIFICHSHTCWSCYDCDRYSYYWESYWRSELAKSKNMALMVAWNALRSSCRGKVETAHFSKGKKILKPLRYPDLRCYRSFYQSKRRVPAHGNLLASDYVYGSSDDENDDQFQKGPSNILLKCTRCDRTWCTHCVHPDIHIISNSGKQIICHDCIHIQVTSTLAQYSKDANNRANIMKRECIMPIVRIDSSHPREIFTQLKHFVQEHATYERKLSLEPVFLSRPLSGGIYEFPEQFSSLKNNSSPIQPNSRRILSKRKNSRGNAPKIHKNRMNRHKIPENDQVKLQLDAKIILKKRLHNMKSKEWNSVVKGCDGATVIKLCGDFKYITSNRITSEIRKLISIPETYIRCICQDRCDYSCTNRLRNIECNVKNCALYDKDCGNRRFSNFISPKLRLQVVEGKGIGAFATEDMDADELVCEYVGEVITHNEFQRFLSSWSFAELDDNNQCHWYIMKIHKDVYIDSTHLGNVSRFINHSCDPNCSSVPINVRGTYRMGVFAKKKILKGEEVTYNYGFTSKGVGGGFKCYCNSKNCRGIIGVQPTYSPESLIKIQEIKNSGAENDILSQLISDMASLSVSGQLQCQKQDPSPLDVLNGIWTVGDLHRYEKLVAKRGLAQRSKISSSNTSKDVIASIPNPLISFLADNVHVSEAQLNYIKLLVLDGMSMKEFDSANTKMFATNIPWSIIAFEHNEIANKVAMESGCTFAEFYNIAKRFIQSAFTVISRHNFGISASENIRSLMDLTWNATEACFSCRGYGDCRYCDYCGDLLHDDCNCGDFYINKLGANLCSLCQNSDHRYKWFLSTEMERECMAMDLWSIRMEIAVDKQMMILREIICGKNEGYQLNFVDPAEGCDNMRNKAQTAKISICEERLLYSLKDLELYGRDPSSFVESQHAYQRRCHDAICTFECFW